MTVQFYFNRDIDRRGTGSSKWDLMETLYGVSPEDGLAMWTADSDYPTAPAVQETVRVAAERGIFGYGFDKAAYLDAVHWWMRERHGWQIATDWILSAHGLGNAIGLCLDVWAERDDGVVIFPPVYHEFAAKIRKAERRVVECPLAREGDRYSLDLEDAQARLDGSEKILIWCSPQNPSGRVWTPDELRAVARFAADNDLLLVSDEVHHDLVYPHAAFTPMDVAAPEVRDRLVVLTAASKTFNIAGQRVGNMIIADPRLRTQMTKRLRSLDLQPNGLGVAMATAAYSPDGAAWVDAQISHLEGNRHAFDDAVNAIPGVRSLPLEATYLAWVDFSGTGMSAGEIEARIRDEAKIAASQGSTFGAGGEKFVRFNLATTRARVEEAGRRLQHAFRDLQ